MAGVSAIRQGGDPIWGAFVNSKTFPHLILWSLENAGRQDVAGAARVATTVRHEIIHYLRAARLIMPDEWAAMAKAAVDKDWIGDHDIEARYPDLSREGQIEEAIAEQFGKWRTERGIEKPGLIRSAFQRMDLLLRRVADAARRFLGRDATANDIFTRIETGQVGKRSMEGADTSGRVAAQTPGEEARIAREAQRAVVPPRGGMEHVVAASDALRASAASVAKGLGVDGLIREAQIKLSPMAARDATVESRAINQQFVNRLRQAMEAWSSADQHLQKTFSHDDRKKMWEAADEQSVAEQQGRPTTGIGLDRLAPAQRDVVNFLQTKAKDVFDEARALGMIETEGLPSYTPRMLVRMSDRGMSGGWFKAKYEPGIGPDSKVVRDIRTLALATAKLEKAVAARRLVNDVQEVGRRTNSTTVRWSGGASLRNAGTGSRALDQIGPGVSTTTPQLRHRKYMTTAETEAAAKRAPPVDRNAPTFVTLNHPAFMRWVPRMVTNADTGKTEPARDQNGQIVFDKRPIEIRSDFEGPLRAVLGNESAKIMRGLMQLKGKSMSLIMMSPLIHNQVEWGRALPLMPGKVATFQIYSEGNRVARDPALMREAIGGGLVPIGGHGFMQDLTSIAEAPEIRPGRSLTAKGAGYAAHGAAALTRVMDPKSSADAVRRGVDDLGNFWHNTLLWDRVRDLQMGIWSNMRDALVGHGFDPRAANIVASHFANRYAGTLPIESMSSWARGFANLALFSRSFTGGNIGAAKDALLGLPRGVQALIEHDVGPAELKKVQSFVRKESGKAFLLDVGLYYGMLTTLQSAVHTMGAMHTAATVGGMIAGGALGGRGGKYGRLAAAAGLGAAGYGAASALGAAAGNRDIWDEARGYWDRFVDMLGRLRENPLNVIARPFSTLESLSSTGENEPGLRGRIDLGAQPDGTHLYAKVPAGKVAEDLIGWITEPNDMLHRKLSTFAKPLSDIWTNDQGFGRKLYNPTADTPGDVAKNIIKIGSAIVADQLPTDVVKGIYDWSTGAPGGDVAGLKAAAPMFSGTTIRKGAPGGPPLGYLYAAKDRHNFAVQEAMPGIRDKIRKGDTEGAVAKMQELGIAPSLQSYYIKTTINPNARMTKRQIDDFMRTATPEEKTEFLRAQNNHADGGAVRDPFEDAATRMRRHYKTPSPPPAAPDVVDTFRSIPRGALLGVSKAISAAGQGAETEMGQPIDVPDAHAGRDLIEQNITGALHQPTTRAGHFGASVGEVIGNPVNYVGPGSLAAKAAWNVASGLSSEAGGELYAGQPGEQVARTLASWGPAAAERVLLGRAAGGRVEGATKIDRSAFLYLDRPDERDFAQCGKCSFLAPGKRCAVIGVRVEKQWSCGLFVPGAYDGTKVKARVSAKDAGLVKGPVRCENCRYGGSSNCKLYEQLNKAFPSDFDLDTKIKPHACCNAFTEKPDRAKGGRVEADADTIERLIERGMKRKIVLRPMPSGANSVRNGPVFIDPSVPPELRRPAAVHETVEEGFMHLGYDMAHRIATAAEKTAAHLLGVAWKPYEHRWDGILSHVERERVAKKDLPRRLHVDPEAAIKRAAGGRVEASNINHDPTEGQKSAGNYAKDHVHVHGLPLTIESAKGSIRRGVDKDGKAWACELPAHYGYLKRTTGADGDHVDVYLGPHMKSPKVFVVDQKDADTGRFDEHKIMLGFSSLEHAVRTYHKGFSDGRGPDRLHAVHQMSIADFKRWLDSGKTTKPLTKAVAHA